MSPDTPPADLPRLPMALPGEAVVDAIDHVEPHLVALHSPTAFEAEQYRILGHQIAQMHKDKGLDVVAISSPNMGDGKTTTVINLAGVLGQTPGMRVLLIETDLRRPSWGTFLGLDYTRTKNLVDAILDPALCLKDAVTWCAPFNFAMLPAGQPLMSHHELIASPRLGDLIQEARQDYNCIIVDTPPLLPLSDCRVIGRWVDGFLVVVSAHKTSRQQLEKALDVIDPMKMIGLIFNQDDNTVPSSYGSYYYYVK